VTALGIVGTVVEDTIDGAGGRRTNDMGGLYYGLVTLAALAPEGAEVRPVCAVGADVVDRVRSDWSSLPGVSLAGIVEVPHVNNKVHLEYRDGGERDETLTGGVPPLGWSDLESRIAGVDAWSWNFVSGMETGRETFARFRSAVGGPLHVDLHSLCLDHPAGGPRRPRRPPDWPEWVRGATWLQLNAVEAGLLWSGEPEPIGPEEECGLAARIHALGVRGVIVTRGEEGAAWHPVGDEGVREPALSPGPALDPTGCGDVLGAAWLALRAGRGETPRAALAGAVRAAGVAATLHGTSGLFDALREAVPFP